MAKLLPMIKPFLYQNGGPIITVQVSITEYSVLVAVIAYFNHVFPLRLKMNMAAILHATITTYAI